MKHIADWSAYWAKRTPAATAVVEPHTNRRWTYAELDRRANRVANMLVEKFGVARGERVALLCHNRGEHFELLFACCKLGAMFAPLNWRLSPAELDMVLADADAKVLFFDDVMAETVARLMNPPPLSAFDASDATSYPALSNDASDTAAGDPSTTLEDPIMLCYTSGTTGKPKGALLSHRQLHFNAMSTQLAIGLTAEDSTLVFMPLFHTGGLNTLATPLLHIGGKVVVMPTFDAEGALRISAAEGITTHMGVPTVFQMIADQPAFSTTDLSAVKNVLCGGAPCPLPLMKRYEERGILFRQGFGMTECGPSCFSLVAEDAFKKAGSIGWPNFYLRARIVDDDGNDVADGEAGELVLGGPMVTLGYFRNADATATAFRNDPEKKWFHTGDVARRDAEGYHYIVDRKKDMFISGGENVYPAEVELAIGQIAGVHEVCVLGVADPRWGEVGRAVIVRASGQTLESPDVLRALDGKLARYKIPKTVTFCDALPRNASGKIQRDEVKKRFGLAFLAPEGRGPIAGSE